MKTYLKVDLTNNDEYARIVNNVKKKTRELNEALRELEEFKFDYNIEKSNIKSNECEQINPFFR
ncbi:hypothetical protein [Streptococcus parauberis]|uniref:hypothetical protein n=1 Tax=Streptococcus parauberis TaxID=1348 RepID=UPI0002DE8338|nr:hypothetical protein [Streptococcus parauberis]QBX17951.1 hypothetical protein Javan385_0048 [Streptococcus phage Javan385]UWM91893.1 hypothetical protein N2A94_04470 [Streptococcus parauberis]